MDRSSRPAPFALTRPRDSFADWFARPPRATSPSLADLREYLALEEPMILVRGAGEANPTLCGAISGAVGGTAMLSVAAVLAKNDLPTAIGSFASRGHLAGTTAFLAAWLLVVSVGAMLGAGFGRLTRRLRNLPALLCFGMLLCGAGWLFVETVVLAWFVPGVSTVLPVAPMTLGAMAFGLVTALALPLRTRRLR